MKFVETALIEIPKHGYFYARKFAKLRKQSTEESIRVLHLLQGLIAADPESYAKDCHKIERLHSLGESQRLEEWDD